MFVRYNRTSTLQGKTLSGTDESVYFPSPEGIRWNSHRKERQKPTKKAAVFLALVCLLAGLFCASFAEGTGAEEAPAPFLQLKPAELSLIKGRSARVAPSVVNLPKGVRAGKFEWTSSDPEVAVCNNGTARGVGGGTAVLACSVTLTDGTPLSAEIPVTVTVPVTGIRTSAPTAAVMAGDLFIPEYEILPADATNRAVRITSSNEQILAVGEDGQVTALAEGTAALTIAAEENPSKKAKLTVTVTRRVGRSDSELTFLGIPWESDCDTCIRILKEKGFIAEEARGRCSYTGTAWHWPENDLLFTRISAWRTLPVSFTDRQAGAGRTSLSPLKTVGGYLPQTSTLVFLNGTNAEGRVDPEVTRLIGVYFNFDNRHEKGNVIFCELLKRLENQYGEFSRYLSRDIPRYYPELYEQIRDSMTGAKEYAVQEAETGDVYLGEYAVCTIRGAGNTGIMLNMDTNGTVTLFYGRTDAAGLIRELENLFTNESDSLEDAGV